MLPQSEFESPMFANGPAPVAIAAITQDRALIGLLRSTIDPSNDLILVSSEAELTPHLNSRRVSAALLDSMFIEGDLAGMAERLRSTWPDLVLVVVGTAEEQSKVAAQITSGVVYRFLHRPVSAPRVRLFVDAALRRHEVENVERTLEQVRPDFSRLESQNKAQAKAQAKAARAQAIEEKKARSSGDPGVGRALLPGILGAAAVVAAGVAWFVFSSGGKNPAPAGAAQVVSTQADTTESAPAQPPSQAATETQAAERAPAQPPAPPALATAPQPQAEAPAARPSDRTDESANLRPASSGIVQVPDETAPQIPSPSPALTHDQRLRDLLAQAESALQRGELASPAGHNAVALFTGALELDPGNTLAQAGLVRVADRLLSAAERALTAGNAEDARNMVAVAESLTPATARGAFLMMQIEMERERASLTRKSDSATQDQQEKSATYVRLANARLRSGALIEPSGDNARFYLDAARQLQPDDPALVEPARALQRQLLDRAASAAAAGNAADTERWLANADGAGAPRQEMTTIRRSLQDTLISARAERVTSLTRSFNAALSGKKLLQPANDSAKTHFLALISTDATSAAVSTARQGLGAAYLSEAREALARGDVADADNWLNEAHTIGFGPPELGELEKQLSDARTSVPVRAEVVGANTLQRLEYVAPRYPVLSRMSRGAGWVEVEFTVRADGSTGDVVVTNSSPRRTFDNAALVAVAQWRYKPVMRDGKAVEQRAAVRIRFAED
ncbi:MAG TPA: TonB family protein [Steroidobacteraceae bacterium]|nr:TonB family protein [Steroidobacteraceae bacterium]